MVGSSSSLSLVWIHARSLALLTCALPLFAFTICLILTITKDFTDSTWTHCGVWNFAPSISATIGSYSPQKYIWSLCLSLHSGPRLLFVSPIVCHLVNRLNLKCPKILFVILCGLQATEILALLVLSLVSSKENFEVHKLAFALFLSSSLLYMLISWQVCIRFDFRAQSGREARALVLRRKLMVVALSTSCLMLMFYKRHNDYCEPFVYSLFGLCEYMFVLTNMAFHMTAYLDFFDHQVHVLSLNDNFDKHQDLVRLL